MAESTWGVIEYPRARPACGEVGHLILVSAIGYEELAIKGPSLECGAMASAAFSADEPPRMFYHLDFDGQRWTWELFLTYWADWITGVPVQVYIGRWPD